MTNGHNLDLTNQFIFCFNNILVISVQSTRAGFFIIIFLNEKQGSTFNKMGEHNMEALRMRGPRSKLEEA